MAHSRTSVIFSISSDIGLALAQSRLDRGEPEKLVHLLSVREKS